MFNPKLTVQSLLKDAYRSGSEFAGAVFPHKPTPDDPAWRESIRDQHCEALVRALGGAKQLDADALGQGVFASAFSGFEDQWRHMTMLPDDLEAISQAGQEIAAAMQISETTKGVFLSPRHRHGLATFDGSNSAQQGLAVQFAVEATSSGLSPGRVLEMARKLYQAEIAAT